MCIFSRPATSKHRSCPSKLYNNILYVKHRYIYTSIMSILQYYIYTFQSQISLDRRHAVSELGSCMYWGAHFGCKATLQVKQPNLERSWQIRQLPRWSFLFPLESVTLKRGVMTWSGCSGDGFLNPQYARAHPTDNINIACPFFRFFGYFSLYKIQELLIAMSNMPRYTICIHLLHRNIRLRPYWPARNWSARSTGWYAVL
jgi:hypothetical protein